MIETGSGDNARVVLFGGCRQSSTPTSCFNDVWMISVSADTSAPITMKQLIVAKTDASTPPTPVEDSSLIIHDDILYIYGGCAVVSKSKKCYSQVRSIPLDTLSAGGTTAASTAATLWSTPATGNAIVGKEYGGVGIVQTSLGKYSKRTL